MEFRWDDMKEQIEKNWREAEAHNLELERKVTELERLNKSLKEANTNLQKKIDEYRKDRAGAAIDKSFNEGVVSALQWVIQQCYWAKGEGADDDAD